MSRPTSTPTRSISSNGPIRKPPPSRQIRSICSTVATRSDRSLSDSSPHGRLQRLTRKPGSVGGDDDALAHRLATGAGDGEGALRRLGAGDHLQQRHQRRRIEEVHAHHPLGVLRRRAPARSPAATRCCWPARSRRRRSPTAGANSWCLSSTRSGAASITISQSAELLERWAPGAGAPWPPRRPRRPSAPCSPRGRAGAGSASCRAPAPRDRGRAAASACPATQPSCAIPEPIVPAPATPSTAGALAARAHEGTSALMPVSARPMMSFWICEVPSYRVVTRTSRK